MSAWGVMRGRLFALATAAVLPLAAAVPAMPAASAQPATCDPTETTPHYRGEVPAPRDVLGFDLGSRPATSAESDRYLESVAAASDRVVAGTLAISAQGRPLKYAIVAPPHILRDLPRLQRDAAALRDPHTPAAQVTRLTRTGRPILWVTANVHGNEPSGTDAALRTLRDLADRTDCAAARIRDNAVVVILPVQNPDGREANTRQNAYGFDMNRDWFARTQPETDGKLTLLNKFPPVLFIDAHEMGGTSYFFPPNADPIYHEVPEHGIDWINNVYGAPMAAEFARRGIDFFTREVFDLFYMGYGDTVPTTGFLSAGMTFEKGGASPYPERTEEQYLTQWVSLSAAAGRRAQLLSQWHQAAVQAYRQGVAGDLEPNQIYNPPNEVVTQVPDRKVRHYFLDAADPAKTAEVTTIVRRLQRMGVTVRRLTRPLRVPDFKPYGGPVTSTTLPAGTYWISMAQGQKHWIQAMLHEDTYTPFPFFFDVTAWSQPLLGNVSGGSSGAVLHPRSIVLGTLPAPAGPRPPARIPKIAVLRLGTTTSAVQATGWLRDRLDRVWKLPFALLTPADVAAGRLGDAEVLLVPNGSATAAATALGDGGRAALQQWVAGGGRYVGWQGGARLAALLGLTSAVLSEPTSAVPGSLLRTKVAPASPLAEGVGDTVWQFYSFDLVMKEADPARVAVSYPAADSSDWFVSGFEQGAAELGGTAAVVDEPVGQGRTVVFAAEPNFRAFTDGTAKLLYNAIVGPDPAARVTALSPDTRAPAPRAAAALPTIESPIRVTVTAADASRTAGVLRSVGAAWTERRTGGTVHFVVNNPQGLPADHHPWAGRLPALIERAGVTPIAVVLP